MSVIEISRPRDVEEKLKLLVADHRAIKEEPLQLAVHYVPPRGGKHIYLFEIADRFGAGTVDSGKKMFEVSYGSTEGFPMEAGQELRLLLTNPVEWQAAVEGNWRATAKLRAALARGHAKVLFATPHGAKLWSLLRG